MQQDKNVTKTLEIQTKAPTEKQEATLDSQKDVILREMMTDEDGFSILTNTGSTHNQPVPKSKPKAKGPQNPVLAASKHRQSTQKMFTNMEALTKKALSVAGDLLHKCGREDLELDECREIKHRFESLKLLYVGSEDPQTVEIIVEKLKKDKYFSELNLQEETTQTFPMMETIRPLTENRKIELYTYTAPALPLCILWPRCQNIEFATHRWSSEWIGRQTPWCHLFDANVGTSSPYILQQLQFQQAGHWEGKAAGTEDKSTWGG